MRPKPSNPLNDLAHFASGAFNALNSNQTVSCNSAWFSFVRKNVTLFILFYTYFCYSLKTLPLENNYFI